MSYHQEDPNVDSEPDVTTLESQNHMSSSVFHHTTIINVSPGANVNLQVGDHNEQHQLSKSLENISQCENCGSTNSSPVTTIDRSCSTDCLATERERYPTTHYCDSEPQGLVDSVTEKLENTLNTGASSPIVIKRNFPKQQVSYDSEKNSNLLPSAFSFPNSIPGDLETDNGLKMDSLAEQNNLLEDCEGTYAWQSIDNSSCCGSESSEVNNRSNSLKSEPPVLPRQLYTQIPLDDGDYMSMTGSSGSLNSQTQSIHRDPEKKDHICKSSGEIPKHKLQEAEETLGFRHDVNGELKRVRTILRPHKFKDGYYVLWKFSEHVLSLSVTYLQEIKNFAVIYDHADQSWLILKKGPRSSSLSTLLQLYIQHRIKLPLSKGEFKGVSISFTPESHRATLPKATTRNISLGCSDANPPPLPPRRASAPLLASSGSPILPPKPQGFLTLQKPVIQY